MKSRLIMKATIELDVDLSEEKFKIITRNLPLHPDDLEEYGLENVIWDSGILEYATSAEVIELKTINGK